MRDTKYATELATEQLAEESYPNKLMTVATAILDALKFSKIGKPQAEIEVSGSHYRSVYCMTIAYRRDGKVQSMSNLVIK